MSKKAQQANNAPEASESNAAEMQRLLLKLANITRR